MVSIFTDSTKCPEDFVQFPASALNRSIPDNFAEVASKSPDKLAVCDHTKSISYSGLQLQVDRAAAWIQRELGSSANPRVIGLIFEPTIESAVGIMGVLASGNAMCPISPNDPPERVLNYLEDAEIDLVLTTRKDFPQNLQSATQSRKVLFIEDLGMETGDFGILPVTIDPEAMAAILYTSGSTGKPKGVTHTHATLMKMIRSKGNELGLSPSDHIAGMARFTFGSYYLNIFGAFLFGSTLHIYDFFKYAFDGLKEWLTDRKITIFHCTPTTIRQFLEVLEEPTVLPDLRLVSLGGETVYPNDVYQFQKLLSGSTALCTTGAAIETWFYASTFFKLPIPEGLEQIPMGFINQGCKVEVRDEKGNKLPQGATGEIYVNSEALSTGYWKQPEQTEYKYVIEDGNQRYFRTGDLGTFSEEGLLYHKGRIDFQIKIRGIRVDLTEIESAIQNHPKVVEAAVIGHTRQDGDTELIAYIRPKTGRKLERSEVYGVLSEKLAPHQIPTRMLFIESFPLTRTHKIDRNALPDPDDHETSENSERISPRNDMESQLHRIWVNVLGHDDFGVTDPFLEIGGDSLKAMRIRAHIESRMKADIPLQEFFKTGTIEALADLVEDNPD